MNHLAGEGIHQEALAIGFPVDIPAGSHDHEPVVGRAHDQDIIAHHLHGHQGAPGDSQRPVGGQAQEPEPGEHQHGKRRGQALDARGGAPVAAHGPHAGAVGEAWQEAEHGA